MPTPLSICIENCYPPHESLRYLRCCAITGVDPGLIVSTGGEILWQTEADRFCEIWVSSDEKLICFRPIGAPPGARIHRAGREVILEENKPVVVIDGDYLLLPDFCYRLHVHGPAPEVTAPGYLDFEEPASSTLARFAAAGIVVLGTLSAAGCGKPPEDKKTQAPPVEVRDTPPAVEPIMQPPPPPMEAMPPPVEVRDEPPKVAPDVEPPPPPPPPPPMDEKPAVESMQTGEMKPPAEMKPPIEIRTHPPKAIAPRKDPLE